MKQLTIETEREVDGRWIAEVPELPGVMVYGSTRDEALAQVEVLALRVLAENIEEDGRPAAAILLGSASEPASHPTICDRVWACTFAVFPHVDALVSST